MTRPNLHTASSLGALVLYAIACALAGLLVLVLGCAHAPVETMVRRCDSLGELAALSRELGREGWSVASVTTLRDGWAYVVVLERRGGLASPP